MVARLLSPGGLNDSTQHFILDGEMEDVAMARKVRRGYTAAEKTEMWDRWQRGESLSSIGRAFGKESSSIHFQILPYGGIRPAPRRRSRLALTLVERHTRYVMLVKVANKDTQTVISALIKQAKRLPGELKKSLTWDRGKELTDHRQFSLATDIDVYFCDPRSPWQRGSNENTNGLLRQYFPKGTDLSVYSQAQLNKVARQLNERPRKTLGFETPAERFNACVASTG
jgi:transposase InsO family protein